MRDYGLVSGTFWTGETGRAIRGDAVTQLVAAYLITAPTSNMIGLYYLPIVVIAHEVGCPFEGASKALRRLSEVGFSLYDADSEVVFVCQMAERQLGKTIKPKDKRHGTIVKLWNSYQKSALYSSFYEKYGESYHLPEPVKLEAPSKPLRSPFKAPSKPGSGTGSGTGSGNLSASTAEVGSDVTTTKPTREQKPKPPRERNPLFDAIAEVAGVDPRTAGSHIAKVCQTLKTAEPPYTPEDVRRFARELEIHCPWTKTTGRTRPELGEIEKYVGRIRDKRPATVGRPGRYQIPGKYDGIEARAIIAGADQAETASAETVSNADGGTGQSPNSSGAAEMHF